MPSWRNGPLTSLKPAGYLEPMLPVTLPEPLPMLQAASMDSVMEALASLPGELREQKDWHIVLLRGRRRLLLLENGNLRLEFLRPDLLDKLNEQIAEHYADGALGHAA